MRRLLTAVALLAFALPSVAGEVASAKLDIVGVGLEVDPQVITGADIPAQVQTKLGGKTGADVPANSLTVAADLTGPGLDAPLTLFAKPGEKLSLPPLHEQGDYALLNVRLLDDQGHFLQPAVPASVSVKVVGVLATSVIVKQLTPEELRARGISVDSRNFDVYDYSFTFAIGDQTVVVPYPVIIDKRTHEVVTAPGPSDYQLPKPVIGATPPRFQPPAVYSMVMEFEDLNGPPVLPPPGGDLPDQQRRRPVIPAALVIPTGFGVLHQFFAVILNVSNSATGAIELDAITATISTPTGLRVVKVNPAVTIGQPVPIRDSQTGAAVLVAQAQGSADWSLEALRTGTHTFDIDIRATYKQQGQLDVPLKGHVSSSLVVSDPRFQVNFVHPDNVRRFETYTAYAFITNTSASSQTVRITNDTIPSCNAANSVFSLNVCRVEGSSPAELTIAAGATAAVPYKLKSAKTGHIYAASAAAPDGVEASVTLTMGVSESGIPLSPATLIMPWYAQYVSPALVEAQMPLLGLGYSVATAPLTPKTALLPRVIRNDVFQRAQDIARAGERIFVTRHAASTDDPVEDREAIVHLSLDLLGNVERTDLLTATPALAEWDQLRMREQSGRAAGAAVARELERTGLAGGKTLSQFASDFAAATSHRSPYFFALVHGGTLTVTGATSKKSMSGAAESPGWVRALPYGELTQFSSATESGQLALVGRWSESLDVVVTPASGNATVDLIYPDTADGGFLTTSFTVSAATTFTVARGNRTLPSQANPVPQTALAVSGAAQDLHLDPSGHIVSLLFNRPVRVADAAKLRDLVSLTTAVAAAGYSQTKKNDPAAPVVIPGAAVSDDGKLLNISFDHALSKNATYVIGLDPISDLHPAGTSFSGSSIVPRIDNDAPGGIVLGKVLRGDNTPVRSALVQLTSQTVQYDTTLADGTFIFEFIPRDIDRALSGNYNLSVRAEGKFAQLNGAVRTPGEVQRVVLQFLGRGSASGRVTYSDGSVVAGAPVTVGSTVYAEFHRATTNDKGEYSVADLPVGPLTFAVQDAKGNVSFAANQIRQPGEAVAQDLVIQKRELAGLATIRVLVKRSDTDAVVPGAHVGVWSQGYGLVDGYTDIGGRYEFRDIPAGFISILAAEFGITLESANADLDVNPDSVVDQTLILHVPDAQAQLATIEGDVKKDDPAAPGDPSRVTAVPGAIIQIGKLAPAVADATGHYTYSGVPVELAGKNIVQAFDPATGRKGTFALPTPLVGGAVRQLPMTLKSTVAQGTATLRVRLTAASGEAVNSYRVIWPGYPPADFVSKGGGRYEMTVQVPAAVDVWAVPIGRDATYGDQVARGSIRADFDGQTAVLDLRLPGQGSVRASILVKKPCPPGVTSCPDAYDTAQGLVGVSYPAWSDQEQGLIVKEREAVATENVTGVATITQVPAGLTAGVATIDHPAGYAALAITLGYEGDSKPAELKLAQLGDVTGRVYNYDGQTPVANAAVSFAGSFIRLDDFTRFDGSFRFPGVAGAQSFRITAKVTINGIERVGYVDGNTPQNGGPVGGLNIVLREQASIEGVIVDASGAPVPLARYWAIGLAWPNQTFDSSAANPLIADQNGRFVLNNVYAGAVRVSASSPVHQEDRGDWQDQIDGEGDDQTNVRIVVGAEGSGSLTVTVVDSDTLYQRVANAEVTLLRNGSGFDFASTDANGTAFFTSLPATGNYALRATSKKVGRSGSIDSFTITANATSLKQVVLNLLGRVSGTVRDGDLPSEPLVRGSPVYLNAATLTTAASTDGAGAFLFNGVPEGTFSLDAIDLDTGRHAKSPTLSITKTIQEIPNVQLKFDKTGMLKVKVYLPDDQGNSSGILAPLALVRVTQAGYGREAQAAGAEVTFTKMFANAPFVIDATELGGEGRILRSTGTFGAGSFDASASVWFATSGTVEVRVTADDPSFVPGSRVVIVSGNKGATVYTDSTGIVTVANMPLGPVSVQVTSGLLTAAASGTLASHSTTLVVPVRLAGNLATLDGFVDAEAGGPSAGTRVILDVTSPTFTGVLHLETRTDSAGKYLFQGIPVSSTHVALQMLGPDNFSIGARASKNVTDGTTAIHIDKVRLDATPPSVIAFDPPNNANSVAPNAQVFVTFTETLEFATVNTSNFKLVASDNNSVVPAQVTPEIVAGKYRVRIAPDALLRSNLVYRVEVSKAVKDLGGNVMTADVASSFTTVNYTEPRIIRADPPVERPVDVGTTFKLKFNKPIDIASFSAPNDGVAKVERLDSFNGAVVAVIPIAAPYLDPADASTLVLAPAGVAIEASSFYRVTVARARDTQQPPNIQAAPQSYNYFSFDHIRPVVTIVSPVAASAPLVSGVSYTPTVTIVDEGTSVESKDIKYVEWLYSDGVNPDQVAAQVFVKPWGYTFTAPSGATRYTLRSRAYDLSDNQSDLVSISWDVVPNAAPTDVVVAVTPSSAYLGRPVIADVTFKDEGIKATVNVDIVGKHLDGSDYHLPASAITPGLNQQVTRATTGVPWPKATFTFNVPPDMLEGAPLHVTAIVEDAPDKQKSAPVTSDVQILTDTNAPQITSITPANDTLFTYPGTYVITVKATDGETSIARVALSYDGTSVDAAGTYDAATQTWTFTKTATITAKVADTRVRILATAYDPHGNKAQAATEVVYKSVNDGSIPIAQWITPLEGAALPAGQDVTLKLRVHATDDVGVQSVAFTSSVFTVAPVTVPAAGGLFERTVTFTVPSAPFTITATVKDADPTHDQTLPIAVDVVQAEALITADGAITAANASSFSGKSLVVSGASTHFYINAPITLQNLIVLGGAQIGNPDRVKLDLTVKDHLFVEADASIDLTGKGYAGGWRTSEDGATTNNNSYGLTAGGAAGATGGASASHAGLGADGTTGATNAAYGSIGEPADFGAGGSGGDTAAFPGARGGGAIVLRGGAVEADLGRLVVAGAIRADGENGASRAGAGAGGSVAISAKSLVTGPATRISANGGDDDGAANAARGGGGGRVAVSATERFELFDAQSQFTARGGRNLAGEGRAQLDGGAGTVFLKKPGAPIGELIVSAFDERNPATTHLTRPTPLSGSLTFDALTAGPRALLRFDDDFTVDAANVKRDPTAVILKKTDLPTIAIATTPASGGSVIQNTAIGVSIDATSDAGVGRVAFTFDAGTPPPVPYVDYPASLTSSAASVVVAPDAALGAATLRATVTDRAGRTATTGASTFTVVANAAPVITRFDITPAGLQTYAGGTIAVDAAATDDVVVTSLDLTATNGTVTRNAPVTNGTTTSRTFSVSTAKTLAGGSSVVLTLKADDNYAAHTATQQKTVTVLHDPNPPVVTISATDPEADHVFEVSSLDIVHIRATVTDAEVGVVSVWATVDGGPQIPMTPDPSTPNGWMVDIPVPTTESVAPVAKQIVVSATDYEPNTGSSAPRRIYVKAQLDPAAPVVSWLCPTGGAMFPQSYSTKLRASAVPGKPENDVTAVTFYVGTSPTSYTASKIAGTTTWEASGVPMPIGTDGTPVVLRVVADAVGNKSTEARATVTLVAGTSFAQNANIITGDTQYDGGTIIVTGGTLTIDGPHTFARLVVLDNATVTSSTGSSLNLTVTGATYVSCLGAIDTSGKGFAGGATYTGATAAGNNSGGSHIGVGGLGELPLGTTYGSVYRPFEAGGGSPVARGGGVIRISGGALTNDGAIRASGAHSTISASGAGGSVWIIASNVGGSGSIAATGGDQTSCCPQGTGGGGAVAVEYSGTASGSLLDNLNARAGTRFSTNQVYGGAGSVYIKGPSSAYGILVIDNKGQASARTADLPSLGKGIAQPTSIGATLVTDRAANILPYFEGHWIEITTASGALKGTWRVATVNQKSVTLAPNGSESIDVQPGDGWQGVYRFSVLRGSGNDTITSIDPIRLGENGVVDLAGPTAAGKFLLVPNGISATTVTVTGNIAIPSVAATTMTLKSGATLSSLSKDVALDVSGTLTIESGAAIDVSGKGFAPNTSYPGATASGTDSGASHIGVGGFGSNPLGATFGSIYHPRESGGGASGAAGGGAVRVAAGTFIHDGAIRANGAATANNSSAAGGSVWIAAANVGGNGSVSATGGDQTICCPQGTGGGGAISVETTVSATGSLLANLNARAGARFSSQRYGGAGSVYLRAPSSVYGDLTVDSKNFIAEQPTDLPAFGIGVAAAGSGGTTLAIGGATDVPAYFEGHWVRITAAGGAVKGTWRIGTVSGKSVVLLPNAGETISIQEGDGWRGVYRFDHLTLRGTIFQTADLLEVTAPIDQIASTIHTGNPGVPVIDTTKISVATSASGPFVAGVAGAITDSDAPILVTVTNGRTHATFTGSIASGAAFGVGVVGQTGDTLTIRAKDSHYFPMETAEFAIQPLPGTTPSVTQIDRATLSGDANFRARTLAIDGAQLAVAGNSDKVAILNVVSPLQASVSRQLTVSNGVINRLAVSNNWLYVAGDDLSTFDLSNPTSTRNLATDSNTDVAIAVAGGYAFTTTPHNTTGILRVFDVSNPAAPRLISDYPLLSGVVFRDVVTYGGSYLFLITPDTAASRGHDLVVVDRSNINNPHVVFDLDVPNFNASRAYVSGTRAYLLGGTPGALDLVTVDLTNPLNPVASGRVTMPALPRNMTVLGADAFVAADAAGLVGVDVTSGTSPTVNGSVVVGGTAYDAVLKSPYAFVANDNGVAVVPLGIGPQINTAAISMALNGLSVSVHGTGTSVNGTAPVRADIANTASGASITGQSVDLANGFNVSLPAAPGDPITIAATDGSGRSAGPISLGVVPFASAVSSASIATALAQESGFRARTMAVDGNRLVVSGWNSGSRIIIYDVTNAAAPVVWRTVAIGGPVWDVAISNGYAIIAADDLNLVSLTNVSAAPIVITGGGNVDSAVAVSGSYAFVVTPHGPTGIIRVYDLADPAAARFVSDQPLSTTVGNIKFRGIAVFGSDYLVAFSDGVANGREHDIVLIDRRDINNLKVVRDIAVPGFDGYRGKVSGNVLYAVGMGGGVAVVDLTNPATADAVVIPSPGQPYGLDVAGSTLAVADGGSGITFFDLSAPLAPHVIGSQSIGGNAWSVLFFRGLLYAANEQRVVILENVGSAPIIRTNLVSITSDGAGNAQVVGAANAVSGLPTITLQVRNGSRTVAPAAPTLDGGGGFTASLDANSGETVIVTAVDGAQRSSSAVVGTVPFGTLAAPLTISTAQTDSNFRARILAAGSNKMIVTGYSVSSGRGVIYDVTNPTAPVVWRQFIVGGPISDATIDNGWAIVAADDLNLFDLSDPAAAAVVVTGSSNTESSVTVSGSYAFVTTPHNSSAIVRVYDISDRKNPRLVSDQSLNASTGNITFRGITTFGTDYLVAFSKDFANSKEHDVVVIDRRDVNNLKVVSDIAIAGFDGFRGKVAGNTLYAVGFSGVLAVVDLTNPALPVVGTVATAGLAQGVDVSGSTIAVADASSGVTFFDATNRLAPIRLGTQPTGGMAWTPLFYRGHLYVANEEGVAVVQNVAAAQTVDARLLSVTTDGVSTATLSASAGAVTGLGPITAALTTAGGGSATPVVGADGSMTAVTIAAPPGTKLTLTTTGRANRSGSITLTVPFAASVNTIFAGPKQASNDGGYRARRVAVAGNYIGVASRSDFGSSRLLVYSASDLAAAPRVLTVSGPVNDFTIAGNFAYIAADDLSIFDLSNPSSTAATAGGGNTETAIALAGTSAFVGTPHNNSGIIRVYNVSNPAAPAAGADQSLLSGVVFRKLLTFGSSHLVGLTTDTASGAERDVVIVNRTNPAALSFVTSLPIANFIPVDAAIDGSTLYVTGGDAGVAIIDLTTPSSPQLLKLIDTPGVARGVAVSGINEIVVADAGGVGVTFIDVTDKQNPVIKGSQFVSGNPADVKVVGQTTYCAADFVLNVIARP